MSTPAGLNRAQSISAKSNTCKADAKNSALPCDSALRIGFFFDGFGRNLKDDLAEDRLSNVARLFMAYPDTDLSASSEPFLQNRRFYISGLASDFDATLGGGELTTGSGMDGATSRAKDSIIKSPGDTISNSPLDAVKDVITGKKWWESFVNNFKVGNAITSALKAAAPAALDISSITRDNPITATFFKTGVDTRLEAAVKALETALAKAKEKSKAPLKKCRFQFSASIMVPALREHLRTRSLKSAILHRPYSKGLTLK